MEATLIKTKNIVIEFAKATKRKDVEFIESLLSDEGEFHMQDKDLKRIEVGKKEFMDWYRIRVENAQITHISYDQCIFCSIGKPVVLFNDGNFPRIIENRFERSKTGLMLNVIDGKISQIAFCTLFANTENKYVYECLKSVFDSYFQPGVTNPRRL